MRLQHLLSHVSKNGKKYWCACMKIVFDFLRCSYKHFLCTHSTKNSSKRPFTTDCSIKLGLNCSLIVQKDSSCFCLAGVWASGKRFFKTALLSLVDIQIQNKVWNQWFSGVASSSRPSTCNKKVWKQTGCSKRGWWWGRRPVLHTKPQETGA